MDKDIRELKSRVETLENQVNETFILIRVNLELIQRIKKHLGFNKKN